MNLELLLATPLESVIDPKIQAFDLALINFACKLSSD